MKKLLALSLCLPLFALPVMAEPQKLETKIKKDARKSILGTDISIHPMVLAEQAFARTSVQKGMRDAFLTYLAEESIIFRPGPVGGKQWFTDHGHSTAQLNWEPAYVEVSSSGDLGFSTGPYEYRQKAAEADKTPPVSHGHFVSVWEKQTPGWRVVVDHGIPHEKPGKKAKLEIHVREGGKTNALGEIISGLSVLDTKFANVTSPELLQELYTAHGAEDLRLYRRNVPPVVGKDKSLKLLPKLPVLVSGAMEAAGMSRNGDLAYSYGVGTMGQVDKDQRSPATYLRLWRSNGKEWKLMLDLIMPLPQEGTAPKS